MSEPLDCKILKKKKKHLLNGTDIFSWNRQYALCQPNTKKKKKSVVVNVQTDAPRV